MKVLIVSNDFVEGELVSLSLRRSGIKVCAVTHPDAVEEFCLRSDIAAIVTFCHHNFLNGRWAKDKFRSMNRGESPGIFLISHIQHERTVFDLYKSSVHQYFALPLHLPRLVTKLNDHIKRLSSNIN